MPNLMLGCRLPAEHPLPSGPGTTPLEGGVTWPVLVVRARRGRRRLHGEVRVMAGYMNGVVFAETDRRQRSIAHYVVNPATAFFVDTGRSTHGRVAPPEAIFGRGDMATHTPFKLYVVLPIGLFRAGNATEPKFDYLRTNPPRKDDEVFDMKFEEGSDTILDHKSGGLSLFEQPSAGRSDWYVVEAGTELPPGFEASQDLTDGKLEGHWTIRATKNIHIDVWKKTLKEWAQRHAKRWDRSSEKRRRV
jgi:hypothetical protein